MRWMRVAASLTRVARSRRLGAQRDDRGGGTEARAQEAHAVEFLQPLAVGHVALAPADVVYVAGVDQYHFEAAFLQNFIYWNPVDPGRFHRDRLDPALRKPICQVVELGGKGAKLAHRLSIPLARDRYVVTLLAAVDAGRVGLNAFQQRGRLPPFAHRSPLVVLHLRLFRSGFGGRRPKTGM